MNMKLKNVVDVFKNLITKDKKEAETSESLQARILTSTLSYNISVMVVDENGESHTPPVPEPDEEEFLVTQGDRVNDFEVVSITEDFLELKSYAEYITGNESTPRTRFIIAKGECISLNMYGVRDAVHKISIYYLGTEEFAERDLGRRDEDSVVTKDDWETEPMPKKNTRFTIKRKFSDADIARIKKGHAPVEMEDRWFYYYEDGKAYYHRSWTGTCIFIVEFNFRTNKHIVTVNRDENQYSNTDFNEDMELINDLLGM